MSRDELEAREKELREELSAVRSALRELTLAEIEEQYGVRKGSIVRDSQGKRYLVVCIDRVWGHDKPWLRGHPEKKDGTFGKAYRRIYFWELEEN